ncbi:HDOD domain-containing protein [Candidatus Methylospira mobilis]|uniref:HDOD domain-containing protein n=1 Tax=Candidatus Methylospira mobilis TaxID=1808979 RepID=A0A5Q0BP19_9GAMM|nr:HDOD domain-containing protein [Candidatus Methylospira mobilis]QFY44011.1 HDOD domain-containing protein [Candidatus Methylospira mobilis]WNV05016.1 HDOD domain-containing protein [Candidatus Methylospira mobilis]
MLNYKSGRLPSLPMVAQKILALNMDNDRDQDALVPAICQCPVTTARIVAMANSAGYGVPGHTVTSVKEAVQRIGLRKAYNSALASALFSMGKQTGKNRLNRDRLWAHNTEVTRVMREIALCLPAVARPTEADIALTGLLHDMGFIIYDALEPTASTDFFKELSKETGDLKALSLQIFEITHEEVGAEVLKLWGIPENIVEAVRHHHDVHSKRGKLSALVVVAEALLRFSDFGYERHAQAISDADVARLLDIDIAQVVVIVGELRKKGLPVIM